jgi:hypothetical protein
VTVDLYGYFFEKTVENLTQGINPSPTAVPGDRLRYTLRLQTTDGPLDDVQVFDDLGELNALPVFQPGSLAIVPGTLPPGATDNSDPNGGTNGAGLIDIRNISVPESSEVSIQFDVTLAAALPDGTVITNQADLLDPVGTKLDRRRGPDQGHHRSRAVRRPCQGDDAADRDHRRDLQLPGDGARGCSHVADL